MGAIDAASIVRLRPGDAPAAMALSTEAKWNQIEADWRFFLTSGIVFGVFDRDIGLVASAALLPYAEGEAWISMVLVTASRQRQGLATRLIDACLEQATRQDRTAFLDATPAGASVYGALGFTSAGHSVRMRFAGFSTTPALLSVASLDELLARDVRAMGFDRSALLQELCGREGSRIVAQPGAVALIRDGRTARHIGPLLADDTAAAARLLAAIGESESGLLLLDVNGECNGLINGLVAAGWITERPFQRMRFGRLRVTGTQPAFAGAGPEYG